MKKKSRERFEEIVKVFAKYGFGYVVDSTINNNRNSPKNFRKAIDSFTLLCYHSKVLNLHRRTL